MNGKGTIGKDKTAFESRRGQQVLFFVGVRQEGGGDVFYFYFLKWSLFIYLQRVPQKN